MRLPIFLLYVFLFFKPQNQTDKLAPIRWLEGTWIAHQLAGPQKEPVEIQMVCHWAETKTALMMELTSVQGSSRVPFMQAMYLWHPKRNAIILWQVTQTGAVNEGEMTGADENGLEQELQVTEPSGQVHLIKTKFERRQPGSFQFVSFSRDTSSHSWNQTVSLGFIKKPS